MSPFLGAVTVRPHVKSHKCPALARRQLASSVVRGLSCATVGEVEAMVQHAGARDVLLTNEVVSPLKIERLLDLCCAFTDLHLAVCVDSAAACTELARRCGARGAALPRALGVLVEANVGQDRCGLDSAEEVAALARTVAECAPALEFRGVQAYQGASQHLRSRAQRLAASESLVSRKAAVTARLAAKGVKAADVWTGGGTGTFALDAKVGALNELQPGSYLFMDADYALNEEGTSVFAPSLFVLATVISVSASGSRFVLDAGIKSHSVDSGLPTFFGPTDFEGKIRNGGDEHLIVDVAPGSGPLPALGALVKLLPGHVDPTFSMHAHVFLCRNDIVMEKAAIFR